jgi:predicted protein tyrosine phosphatase
MEDPGAERARPNEFTYWVTDHLMAGFHPADKSGDTEATRRKLEKYIDAGVDAFVDLTEEGQRPAYEDIAKQIGLEKGVQVDYARTPFPDDTVPTTEQMKIILGAIEEGIGKERKVYVHCAGGIGRTGTTVGCYLSRHGDKGEAALVKLNSLYQTSSLPSKCATSPATEEQKDYVRNWE